MDAPIKRRLGAGLATLAIAGGLGGVMAASAVADDPATDCSIAVCSGSTAGSDAQGGDADATTGDSTAAGQGTGTGVGTAQGGDQTNAADQSNTSTNDNQSTASAEGGKGGSATGVGQSAGDANTTGGATSATIVVNVPGSSDKAAASALPFVVTTPTAGPLSVTLALPADLAGSLKNQITGDNTVLINSIVAQITAKLQRQLHLSKQQNQKLTKQLRKQMTSFSKKNHKLKVSLARIGPDKAPRV